MNNRLLNFSLAGNVILLGVLVFWVVRWSPVPGKKESAPVTALSGPAASVAAPAVAPVSPKTMAQLIPQLRAANVPESLLARAEVADFDERWDKRRDEMQARFDNGDIDDVELQQFNERYEAEQEKELRAVLGDDAFVQWDKKSKLNDLARLHLSAQDSDAIYRLKKEFHGTETDLNRRLRDGEIDDADYNEKLAAAQKQYDGRMETVLGEDRFAAYQNPQDGLAGDLKRNLRALNASDEQFAALLDAQRSWNEKRMALDAKYSQTGTDNGEYTAQLQALDAARDQQNQQVLGTNGVALLERQRDNNYQTLKRYETIWQLTDVEVDHLYATLHDYQKTVDDYRQRAQGLENSGQDVDWPAVEANVQQFGRQIEQGLKLYLGADRFQKIRRNEIFNLASEVAGN